jgi:signal transduction histidine kinase
MNWSLRTQMAVSLGGVTLILVLFLGVAAERRERSRLTSEVVAYYTQMLSVLEATLTDAIVAEDSALMTELTSRLGAKDDRLLRIVITDAQGDVLNQWIRTQDNKVALESEFTTDVMLDGRVVGRLLLVQDGRRTREKVSSRVWEVRLVMIGSLLLVGFVVGVMIWRLGGSVDNAFAQDRVPQIRASLEGRIESANELGKYILKEWSLESGESVGGQMPALFEEPRQAHAEVQIGKRTYGVHAVTMTDFNSVYLSFNDVTESRILTRIPGFNPNPVLRLTPNGVITYANAASERLLAGWNTQIGGIVPAEVLEHLSLDSEQTTISVSAGNLVYDLNLVNVPALDYINVFATDMTHVTELEAARERLVQKEKMAVLGGLVAGVAHELNTPLGVTMIAAGLLEEETTRLKEKFASGRLGKLAFSAALEQLDQIAHLVLSNSKKAAQLIESFKGVAVDQSNAAIRSIQIRPYLDQIITSLGPYLNRQRLTVEVDGADFGLSLPAGPFSQVITNLLQNAAIHAYKEQGGGVRIWVSEPVDGRFQVQLSDQGAGIPATALPRIFEPLFTTRLGSGGSGLGLNICYKIVDEVLNGSLTATSEVGKGATFTMELPLASEIPKSASHTATVKLA